MSNGAAIDAGDAVSSRGGSIGGGDVMRMATKSGVLAVAMVLTITSPAAAETSWPISLNPIGEGYPVKGSVCRQMGESAVTVRHLDDSAVLVGCPGAAESVFVRKYVAKIGGRVVDEIDGVTLISISHDQQAANAAARDDDAKAIADVFKPAGQLRCALTPSQRLSQCSFGIARKRGLTVVKIAKPDGGSREIYFANDKVVGSDVDKTAGTAKRRVLTTREVDLFMIAIGEERYEILADVVSRAGGQ